MIKVIKDIINILRGRRVSVETPEDKETRFYGGDGTWHQTGEINVELDSEGKVVSVWYRCQLLPFTQRVVDSKRARAMRSTYDFQKPPAVYGVTVKNELY